MLPSSLLVLLLLGGESDSNARVPGWGIPQALTFPPCTPRQEALMAAQPSPARVGRLPPEQCAVMCPGRSWRFLHWGGMSQTCGRRPVCTEQMQPCREAETTACPPPMPMQGPSLGCSYCSNPCTCTNKDPDGRASFCPFPCRQPHLERSQSHPGLLPWLLLESSVGLWLMQTKEPCISGWWQLCPKSQRDAGLQGAYQPRAPLWRADGLGQVGGTVRTGKTEAWSRVAASGYAGPWPAVQRAGQELPPSRDQTQRLILSSQEHGAVARCGWSPTRCSWDPLSRPPAVSSRPCAMGGMRAPWGQAQPRPLAEAWRRGASG